MDKIIGLTLAERFKSLFAGLDRAYGIYRISKVEQSGKRVGVGNDIKTVKAPVTLELWENHLSGVAGIGITPIQDGDTCVFGAIDVDLYDGFNHKSLAEKLKKYKIPLAVCRTKSGGAHLYCFTKEKIQAQKMRIKLSEIAAFLGYGRSEIFPKQSHVVTDQGDVGSWINMPYYDGSSGMRYCVAINGDAMDEGEFLDFAESIKVEADWFNQLLVINEDFPDGPPCLQALASIGYPEGVRNDGMFNIAVYLRRAMPDTWETALEEYNQRYMHPPLASQEIGGLIKATRKKEYQYGCSKSPILQHCNSSLCKTRKFGVGGMAGKMPSFGDLAKLDTVPPIWFWTIDGVRVELTTIEMQDQRAFQRRCMEAAGIVTPIVKLDAWHAILQVALENVMVVEVPKESSAEGQFWEMLETFCRSRAQATDISEIVLGKPWTDSDKTYFRLIDLLGFLQRAKFFEFKSQKITSILRDNGAQHHFKTINGRAVNYWSVPKFADATSPLKVPFEATSSGEIF